MDFALLLISLLLAAILGFAARRASVCTVLAVAEVLSTRRAHILLSFLKTVLWVLAVTLPLIWLMPAGPVTGQGWVLSIHALVGGFLFGVGAGLNGGCAFSTLWKLGTGQLKMLATLAAFTLGAAAYLLLVEAAVLPAADPVPLSYAMPETWAYVLLAGLGLWALWEALRLWRTRPAGSGWKALIFADIYRLSTAAALLGLTSGVLYALHGTWTFTSSLRSGVAGLMGTGAGPSAVRWALFAAMLAGMALAAWQSGAFRLVWRPSRAWARNMAGGLLMGLGAGMAAGGNDVLLLHSIPGLSPHAVPTFAALLLGIACVLTLDRLIRGTFMRVDCGGDRCSAD